MPGSMCSIPQDALAQTHYMRPVYFPDTSRRVAVTLRLAARPGGKQRWVSDAALFLRLVKDVAHRDAQKKEIESSVRNNTG
eukprot:6201519-Pleurochrysis_carterae.AAC.2